MVDRDPGPDRVPVNYVTRLTGAGPLLLVHRIRVRPVVTHVTEVKRVFLNHSIRY